MKDIYNGDLPHQRSHQDPRRACRRRSCVAEESLQRDRILSTQGRQCRLYKATTRMQIKTHLGTGNNVLRRQSPSELLETIADAENGDVEVKEGRVDIFSHSQPNVLVLYSQLSTYEELRLHIRSKDLRRVCQYWADRLHRVIRGSLAYPPVLPRRCAWKDLPPDKMIPLGLKGISANLAVQGRSSARTLICRDVSI